MKFDKNDNVALIGTLAFHTAIILLLFYVVLRTTVPEDDGGVLVNFGNLNAAAGVFEPRPRTAPTENIPVPEVTPKPPTPAPREEMITQNEEETVALTNRKKEEERKRQEEAERKKKDEEARLAEQRRKEEQRRQGQRIDNLAENAFGQGNDDSNTQGDASSGVGNQGSPFGNAGSGANEGVGVGLGGGLAGRSLGEGSLLRPSYDENEEGRIVIDVLVDATGKVIMADIGKGTTVINPAMRRKALDKARQQRFKSITGNKNESGTITYNYKLK